MTIQEIVTSSKESIILIITGFSGSIAHILNKTRKGEKLSFSNHMQHLAISGFVGYLSFLLCTYYGIDGPMQGIIIGVASYSGITIIDAVEMIKAKTISNFILDFIKFKIGK